MLIYSVFWPYSHSYHIIYCCVTSYIILLLKLHVSVTNHPCRQCFGGKCHIKGNETCQLTTQNKRVHLLFPKDILFGGRGPSVPRERGPAKRRRWYAAFPAWRWYAGTLAR